MSTLLLRLQGPMQSYGLQSAFNIRDTASEPTKSAVLGIICAALGIGYRQETAYGLTLGELNKLKVHARIDRHGVVKPDFHTAKNVPKIGENSIKETVVTRRFYIYDADFRVAVEGDRNVLQTIKDALLNPRWFMYIGRKSCVPASPVYYSGPEEISWQEAFAKSPWHRLSPEDESPKSLACVYEDERGEIRQDVPVSFLHRTFTYRYVRRTEIPLPCVEDDLCILVK